MPDTLAPMRPPSSCSSGSACLMVVAATMMATASANTIVEWPSEKKKPMPKGPLAFLQHEPYGVVDRRDVIGVEGVAQTEHVGDEAEPDQRRMAGAHSGDRVPSPPRAAGR